MYVTFMLITSHSFQVSINKKKKKKDAYSDTAVVVVSIMLIISCLIIALAAIMHENDIRHLKAPSDFNNPKPNLNLLHAVNCRRPFCFPRCKFPVSGTREFKSILQVDDFSL